MSPTLELKKSASESIRNLEFIDPVVSKPIELGPPRKVIASGILNVTPPPVIVCITNDATGTRLAAGSGHAKGKDP
jgi:hypothetical protein